MNSYIVKVQCDMTGTQILCYDYNRTFIAQFDGEQAAPVIKSYGLKAMTKVYVQATVDDKGFLELGEIVEGRDW